MALLALFFVGPIIYAFYGSFTNLALTGPHAQNAEFIGLQNYETLLSDPGFPLALLLTVVLVVASAVVGQNVLGMILALLLTKSSRLVGGIARSIVVLAWVLPEIVAAFVLYAFFQRDGTLTQVLHAVGLDGTDWLYTLPMLAITLGNIWRGTAFSMLVYQAALGDVPDELIEASMMDGAGAARRLFSVVLPVIRPTVLTNMMLISLQTLAVFTLIWVMTAGGPLGASSTLSVYAYRQAFKIGEVGYGTAVAVVMLLVGAVFAAIYVRFARPTRA